MTVSIPPTPPRVYQLTGTSTVEKICRELPLSQPVKSLAALDPPPMVFLEALLVNGWIKDIFLFLAACLPKREAVGWACIAAWLGERPEPPPLVAATYRAVIDWLVTPNESNRLAAEEVAKKAPNEALGTMAAWAVFCSGENIARPDLPPVAPPRVLFPQTIANTVFLASRYGDPALIPQRERLFLRIGLDVVDKVNRGQLIVQPPIPEGQPKNKLGK